MESKSPSIDLVYDLTMKQYELISSWIQAIDNKVSMVLGTATIAFSVMVGISAPSLRLDAKLIPFALGAVLFIATCYFLLQCLKSHSFKVIFSPTILLNHYVRLTPEQMKLVVVKHSIEHYKENTETLNKRACNLNYAVYCMIGEILFLFLGLIFIN